MKLTMQQLRRLIREVRRAVGDVAFSGKYFDVIYSAKGRSVAKDIYVIVHRPTNTVIETSKYNSQLSLVKKLVKKIERELGPALDTPDLESDFETLSRIHEILRFWNHPAPGRQIGWGK